MFPAKHTNEAAAATRRKFSFEPEQQKEKHPVKGINIDSKMQRRQTYAGILSESQGRLDMKYDLPKHAEEDIIRLAKKNNIKKVILFGSRARGTNTERSDIDIAVSGGDTVNYYFDLEENAHTLLTFDVVNLNQKISDELQKEIARDGVILYEKV